MKGFIVATAFLTRVPVPIHASEQDVGHAVRWFPIVGSALGAAAAGLTYGLDQIPNLPSAVQALLLIGLGAWITGAIHLDGLADTADGFGGGATREERLRIMRDPQIGSFGALALILVVGLKAAALAALLDRNAALPALIAAPTLSRWTVVMLGAWLPYARPEGGLGRAATNRHDWQGPMWATTIAAVVVLLAVGVKVVWLAVIAVLVMTAVGFAARSRIGGVTGDVFGAAVELTETAVLVAALVLTARP